MVKKGVISLLILCIVLLFTFSGNSVQVEQEKSDSENVKIQDSTSSVFYTGIVIAHLDNADNGEEVVLDFGNHGIWIYDEWVGLNYAEWSKINDNDPDWMIAVRFGAPDYEIVADFGSKGLWWWNSTGIPSGVWTKINDHDAEFGFAVDDDADGKDEIHVDFGSLGLWRYDYDTDVWTKINKNSPTSGFRSNIWAVEYEEGMFDFGSSGLWHCTWTGSPYFWYQLNKSDPGDDNVSAELGIGSAEGEMGIDFGSAGLWVYYYTGYTNWYKINNKAPAALKEVRFAGAPDYELLCTFHGVPGLWWWNHSGFPGTWTKINGNTPDVKLGFCEPFDPNGGYEGGILGRNDEEVAVDFGSKGLWLYDYTDDSWRQLNANNPESMVSGELLGGGYKDFLIVDFGNLGLWWYDGAHDVWWKINSHNVDND